MHQTTSVLGFVLIACGWLSAQQAGIPRLGFVEDREANRIHPLLGIPGAAHVGPSVEFGDSVVPLGVSSSGDYIFVLEGPLRKPALWLPELGLQPLAEVPLHPSRFVSSPTGSAAALYYPDQNIIQTLVGLPSKPSLSLELPLGPAFGVVGKMAVSDDGKVVLCTISGGLETIVFSGRGEINRLTFSHPPSALAFGVRSYNAVVAAGSEAILIRSAGDLGEILQLPVTGLGPISVVALTPAGDRVVLASAEASRVDVISLETTTPIAVELQCPIAPVGISRLAGGQHYILGFQDDRTVWMLDLSAAPRILAVLPSIKPDNLP